MCHKTTTFAGVRDFTLDNILAGVDQMGRWKYIELQYGTSFIKWDVKQHLKGK